MNNLLVINQGIEKLKEVLNRYLGDYLIIEMKTFLSFLKVAFLLIFGGQLRKLQYVW